MTRSLSLFILCAALVVPLASHAEPKASVPSTSSRTLDDYRHFRAATIDLLGRMPTRDELAAFERPDFDWDTWVDHHLSGPGYVERLTRIYMDQLRLEPNVNFSTAPSQLARRSILGPDGNKIDVYFRSTQRRVLEKIDGTFCFSQDELTTPQPPPAPPVTAPKPPPKPMASSSAQPAMPPAGMSAMTPMPPRFAPPAQAKVAQKLLDERTVLVRPWWLYRDYRDAHPVLRYQDGWKLVDAEYRPTQGLLQNADGSPTIEVRVCKEEAQTGELGHVYASGRTTFPPVTKAPPPKPGQLPAPMPPRRLAPLDRPFATQHKGETIACDTKTALESSVDCGCGRGLERCMPTDSEFGGAAFEFPNHMPLGPAMALDSARQQAQRWFPYWWSREAVRFLGYLFDQDRDFREILTGKETLINGPLAQFYRTVQRGNCCGPEASFGMTEETEPLFDPKKVPAELMPHDVGNWMLVADRGPHAAGIMTMPMFLEKYASARARGAVLYNTFLCKSFIAENVELSPSNENNLMIRPGCSTCHATLEPLAAYFARIEPGSFVFLPPSKLPTVNPSCKKGPNGKMSFPGCNQLYDVAFADDKGAPLRSAYGSPKNADATPVGAGDEITKMPEFAQCAASRVTSSFLGRATNADDEALLKELTTTFRSSGFKMRALVRGILKSSAYKRANNLSSTSWRAEPPAGAQAPGRSPPDPHAGMNVTKESASP